MVWYKRVCSSLASVVVCGRIWRTMPGIIQYSKLWLSEYDLVWPNMAKYERVGLIWLSIWDWSWIWLIMTVYGKYGNMPECGIHGHSMDMEYIQVPYSAKRATTRPYLPILAHTCPSLDIPLYPWLSLFLPICIYHYLSLSKSLKLTFEHEIIYICVYSKQLIACPIKIIWKTFTPYTLHDNREV